MSTWNSYGHRFYPRFLKNQENGWSVQNAYSNQEILDGLTVCVIDVQGHRHFGLFKNYLNFGMYLKTNFPEERTRTFFEVVSPIRQKPHFDLEIEIENGRFPQLLNSVIENLFTCIDQILKAKGVELNFQTDILLYNSSGPFKQSAHVVIDNWCHVDNVEAKAFYSDVTDLMIPELAKYVDPAVYSQLQQFRMVGNQKLGSGRVKRQVVQIPWQQQIYQHQYEEEPESENHLFMIQLGESLLSNAKYCKVLPSFSKMEMLESGQYVRNHGFTSSELEADESMVAGILAMIGTSLEIDPSSSEFPFEFKDIAQGIILLNRLLPSYCSVCQRYHENENPYVYVTETKSVYFCCRRHEKGTKLYLGKYSSDGAVQQTQQTVEQKYQQAQEYIPSLPSPVIEIGEPTIEEEEGDEEEEGEDYVGAIPNSRFGRLTHTNRAGQPCTENQHDEEEIKSAAATAKPAKKKIDPSELPPVVGVHGGFFGPPVLPGEEAGYTPVRVKSGKNQGKLRKADDIQYTSSIVTVNQLMEEPIDRDALYDTGVTQIDDMDGYIPGCMDTNMNTSFEW